MARQRSASGINEEGHPEQGKKLRTDFPKKSKYEVRSHKS